MVDDAPDDESPTEEQTDHVCRCCLDAARLVVAELQIDGDLECETVTRIALRALAAANDAQQTARQELGLRFVFVDLGHIVATALFEGLGYIPDDERNQTHPYSAGGLVLEGFARASRLLESYGAFDLILEDDGDFGTEARHARKILDVLPPPLKG